MTSEPHLREGVGYFGPAYPRANVETLPEPGRTIYGGAFSRAQTELKRGLRGVTTDSSIVPGLFPRRRTGVSLAPVVVAAEALLGSLDAAQRQAITFEVDDDQRWRAWHNM